MFSWLDRLWEKLGRKYALVDFYGDILGYRYYVLFVEHVGALTWMDRWMPNLFVHHYIGVPSQDWFEDRESHSHPWPTFSVILRGGYREEVNNSKAPVWRKALGFAATSVKSVHRIDRVIPNTISLFFHGIRSSQWALAIGPCDNPCKSCVELNAGKCMKTEDQRLPFPPSREILATSKARKGWRAITWIKVDADFTPMIAERRASIARRGIAVPTSLVAKNDVYRKKIILKETNLLD